MPKRLTKRRLDDEIYSCWFTKLCTFGLRDAKKIVWGAYVELRRQERELKKKVRCKNEM